MAKVAEIVGPAGAGKSTLARLLSQGGTVELAAHPPFYRRAADFPFFATNTLRTIPTFLALYRYRNGRWFTREETAWMIILNGWSRKLRCGGPALSKVVLVDEGPIFHLAYLFMLGPQLLRGPHAGDWWRKQYQQIANNTDVVVWLDARNDSLIRRIRTRQDGWSFPSKADAQLDSFLHQLRAAYLYVVPCIRAHNKRLIVLQFDTEVEPMAEIVTQVTTTLETLSLQSQ